MDSKFINFVKAKNIAKKKHAYPDPFGVTKKIKNRYYRIPKFQPWVLHSFGLHMRNHLNGKDVDNYQFNFNGIKIMNKMLNGYALNNWFIRQREYSNRNGIGYSSIYRRERFEERTLSPFD